MSDCSVGSGFLGRIGGAPSSILEMNQNLPGMPRPFTHARAKTQGNAAKSARPCKIGYFPARRKHRNLNRLRINHRRPSALIHRGRRDAGRRARDDVIARVFECGLKVNAAQAVGVPFFLPKSVALPAG